MTGKFGTEEKLGCAVISLWLTGIVISLLTTAGLIYIAVHFIAKYW